jgi:hypothetical protein
VAIGVRWKIAGAVLGAALAGSLALVPFGDDAPRPRDTGQEIVLADAKEAVPSRTATDWVSYGDQVAVVRVAAEHERHDAVDETGEEYLARTVDLRVEERVWARPGAPALPDTLSVTADGWEVKGGTRVPVGAQDASRLEVGHDYVISFARFSDGAWAPLGSGGVLPYDNGRVGEGEFEGETVTVDAYRSAWERQLVAGGEEPLAFRAAGKPAAGVGAVLRSTAPDATAARYFGLDAAARYEKVTGAAEPADTFCSVAAPLAVSEESRYTPDELASVLTDLAELAPEGGQDLHAYAASLEKLPEPSERRQLPKGGDTARKASITAIERECGIDVGDLLPQL